MADFIEHEHEHEQELPKCLSLVFGNPPSAEGLSTALLRFQEDVPVLVRYRGQYLELVRIIDTADGIVIDVKPMVDAVLKGRLDALQKQIDDLKAQGIIRDD